MRVGAWAGGADTATVRKVTAFEWRLGNANDSKQIDETSLNSDAPQDDIFSTFAGLRATKGNPKPKQHDRCLDDFRR